MVGRERRVRREEEQTAVARVREPLSRLKERLGREPARAQHREPLREPLRETERQAIGQLLDMQVLERKPVIDRAVEIALEERADNASVTLRAWRQMQDAKRPRAEDIDHVAFAFLWRMRELDNKHPAPEARASNRQQLERAPKARQEGPEERLHEGHRNKEVARMDRDERIPPHAKYLEAAETLARYEPQKFKKVIDDIERLRRHRPLVDAPLGSLQSGLDGLHDRRRVETDEGTRERLYTRCLSLALYIEDRRQAEAVKPTIVRDLRAPRPLPEHERTTTAPLHRSDLEAMQARVHALPPQRASEQSDVKERAPVRDFHEQSTPPRPGFVKRPDVRDLDERPTDPEPSAFDSVFRSRDPLVDGASR